MNYYLQLSAFIFQFTMQHPGVLLEQVLKERALTQKQFAVLL
jgi:hypothetical protein